MKAWNDGKYSHIIGYGIGQYYENTKAELSKYLKLDYLFDRKWEESDKKEYDGIALVRRSDLIKFQNALVIVFTGNTWIYHSIQSDLNDLKGIDHIHVDEIIGRNICLTGKMLREEFPDGIYEDGRNNKIYFDRSLSDKLMVLFQGSNNVLHIRKNVLIENLRIRFGNHGICSIDENTEIIGAEFYVADAKIQIGKDCLFGNQVILRTHDAHHIFDMETHQRMNHSKDIVVGDNVWITSHVTLRGGAGIGTGSVVGTNAVTSNSFGNHVIIAGVPAKIIRENICWSRDDTEYFNRSCLEECVWQNALKYL